MEYKLLREYRPTLIDVERDVRSPFDIVRTEFTSPKGISLQHFAKCKKIQVSITVSISRLRKISFSQRKITRFFVRTHILYFEKKNKKMNKTQN